MLYWNTVYPALQTALKSFMSNDDFSAFRLVGGTALTLHLGHRMSVDIDLFTDAPYNSVDFAKLEAHLSSTYRYFVTSGTGLIGLGNSYYIGESAEDNIKLDIYYTDTFIQEAHVEDGIRLATVEEIAAMKMNIILRGGRKKDFWDIDEILEKRTLEELIALHELRHPYEHSREVLLEQLVNFDKADEDYDPICLKGKVWELIKYDLTRAM